jgi:hypothetical protein
VFLFFTSDVKAQIDTVRFEGILSVNNSATYKYKIAAAPKNDGKWYGYTILDEGGTNYTVTSVTVSFSKEKQAMLFAENSLIYSRAKEKSFCFVGGLLKMYERKHQLKGFFVGRDEHKHICGNGSVQFKLPINIVKLMTPDGTNDSTIPALVTNQKSTTFKTSATQIQIEIWDAGVNDGDSISLVLNGNVVQAPFGIVNEKKVISLHLLKGDNVLIIKAINEGSAPPNTARIVLFDQNNKLPLISFLKKEEEAIVKIFSSSPN